MLVFYTGVPGSGKTYRAVDHAYNCFIDEKSKDYGKYKRLYTNINEFNFDAFNDKHLNTDKDQFAKVSALSKLIADFKSIGGKRELITNESALAAEIKEDVAFKIDMDNLLESLKTLHDLYLTKASDSDLMYWANKLNISDSLFIIDEAHNIFDAENELLIWWLTYHRHLHQDIILITQNLSLFFRKYLTCGEFFYRAVPSSLRVRSGVFTYHEFISSKMYKKDHTNSVKVKFRDEVFALYTSGANTQGKKVIYKFIAIAAVLAVMVGSFFAFVIPMMWGGDSNASKPSLSSPMDINTPIDTTAPMTVVCVGFDCSYLGQNISLPDLNGYVKKYSLVSIETVSVNDGITLRTFSRNDNFLSEVFNVSIDSSASN